jgi:hypothetical protein
VASPNDIKLRARTDGNSIRLGESATITATLAVVLAGTTLAASGSVVGAPAPSGEPVRLSGYQVTIWTRWDG